MLRRRGGSLEGMTMEYRGLNYRKLYAPDKQSSSHAKALNALDELQTMLAQREVDLAGWARDLRTERRADEPR